MATLSESQLQQERAEREAARGAENHFPPLNAIGWGSLVFAALQSICTALIALNGVRLAIGLGSVVLAASVSAPLNKFHADKIRIPMMGIALAGALLNLLVLWQGRRLRRRPAAQWRVRPMSAGKQRTLRFQMALSVLTLALLAVEEYIHFRLHHIL